MSHSMHVYGFKDPDEKWRKMKAIFDAFIDAGLEPSDEVQDFFAWETPDPSGVEVKITAREFSDRATLREGFEVILSELPKDVTRIRFVNSY